MKLSNQTKVVLLICFLAVSSVGFLIRLPSVFRHVDKEMHSLFYFLAAALLNLLFANKNITRHIVIFVSLYCFSMGIEYAQEYSNKLFHKRIHGRYDVEDVQANLKGLVLFSVLWCTYTVVVYLYNIFKLKKLKNSDTD